MYSELECGICYRTYNTGRRCPRQLHCRHGFCESCLRALARAPGAHGAIACPLCRQTTSITGEGRTGHGLRLDEGVLERLSAAGVLDREQEEEEEEEEEDDEEDGQGATIRQTAAEDSDSSARSRVARLRRSWSKFWRKINGDSSRHSSGQNYVTGDDLRNLAIMSCHMF